MKYGLRNIGAWVLVFGMMIAIFPAHLFHNHSHHFISHDSEHLDECSNHLIHGQVQKRSCEHRNHFGNPYESCELCDLVSSKRVDFFCDDVTPHPPKKHTSNTEFKHQESSLRTIRSTKKGRAPPFS